MNTSEKSMKVGSAIIGVLMCFYATSTVMKVQQEEWTNSDLDVLLPHGKAKDLKLFVSLRKVGVDLMVNVALKNDTMKNWNVPPLSTDRLYVEAFSSVENKVHRIPRGPKHLMPSLKNSELVRLIPGNTLTSEFVIGNFYKKDRHYSKLRVYVFEKCGKEWVDIASEFALLP